MQIKLNTQEIAKIVSSLFCSAAWTSLTHRHKGEKIYVTKDQFFSNGEKFRFIRQMRTQRL